MKTMRVAQTRFVIGAARQRAHAMRHGSSLKFGQEKPGKLTRDVVYHVPWCSADR